LFWLYLCVLKTNNIFPLSAHWVVTWLFTLLKPFLSKNTQSKVNLYDSNEAKWKAALSEKLPASSIPEDYGGTGSSVLDSYKKKESIIE
jgi:hypothetical protein